MLPTAQPKSLWKWAEEWLQQKIVQPVQQAVPKVMNWINRHQGEIECLLWLPNGDNCVSNRDRIVCAKVRVK